MAHVKFRHGRWFIVTDQRTENGKRRQSWDPTDAGSREDAEAEMARRQLLVSEATVGGYLTGWAARQAVNLRPSTAHSYSWFIEKYLVPRIGAVELERLTADELDACYSDMVSAGLSARTVRYGHSIIRKALNDAVRKRRLPANVALAADPPRAQQKEMHCWTAADARRFLKLVRDDPWYELWLLLLSAGLRRGEVLALQWHDLEDDRLLVRRNLSWTGKEWHVGAPKTRKGFRTVALDPHTAAALRARQVRTGGVGNMWMFETRPGQFMSPATLPVAFARLVAKHELPRIRLHDLRHTHATLGLQAGVDTKVMSERLGHHSAAFTADRYQHVLPGMQEAAAGKMATVLFG